MQKALFLDRDGVINEDFDYVHRIEDFKFKNGIFEFCQLANSKGYLIFIITNQAGIARGYYSERDFLILSKWMLSEFKKNQCTITKVFFCPYHPDYGIGKFRRNSFFRKPGPGMILKAAKRFSVDLSESILIGDQLTDIEAGMNAGIKRNILIVSPKVGDLKYSAEYIKVNSLKDALDHIV